MMMKILIGIGFVIVLVGWLKRASMLPDLDRLDRKWVYVRGLSGDRIRMRSRDAEHLVSIGAVIRDRDGLAILAGD